MTSRQEEDTWELYDRDYNDFPRPSRGYHEEELDPEPDIFAYTDGEDRAERNPLPEASDDADNECGGVLGAERPHLL